MKNLPKIATAVSCLPVMIMLSGSPASASNDPALDSAVHALEIQWETIKFTVKTDSDEQHAQMDALGEQADALAAKYPDRAEALIWDGIITSERASMANPLSALGLAKRAKGILEKAYALDPTALGAGAATSLGVLYYRVPGFPIGFGDNKKARQLLKEAVTTAPEALDAEYFYGDFLYTQGELPQADAVFSRALEIPEDPDRPLWDKYRRIVIGELRDKIAAKR